MKKYLIIIPGLLLQAGLSFNLLAADVDLSGSADSPASVEILVNDTRSGTPNRRKVAFDLPIFSTELTLAEIKKMVENKFGGKARVLTSEPSGIVDLMNPGDLVVMIGETPVIEEARARTIRLLNANNEFLDQIMGSFANYAGDDALKLQAYNRLNLELEQFSGRLHEIELEFLASTQEFL